jgi:hypothetical protein
MCRMLWGKGMNSIMAQHGTAHYIEIAWAWWVTCFAKPRQCQLSRRHKMKRSDWIRSANYVPSYHIPSLLELDLSIIDQLFRNQPLVGLTERDSGIYWETKGLSHIFWTRIQLAEFIDRLHVLPMRRRSIGCSKSLLLKNSKTIASPRWWCVWLN